ncbi:hypothetical protein ACFLQX_01685 [Bacteroidota bacterium]
MITKNILLKISRYLIIFLLIIGSACGKKPQELENSGVILIKSNEVINSDFIGNGAQWGGYELLRDWTGNDDFSNEDWEKLKLRIDYMRPPFLRIMVDGNWNYIRDNTYDRTKTSDALLRILQYCQDNDITVMFGEWGHKYLNGDITNINEQWLSWAADYLDWMVNTNGFTCIKYFNMVNEPNGDWSSTNGNYTLWRSLMTKFQTQMENRGLDEMVQLVGPDVAVWDAGLATWVSNTARDMGDFVDLYDIHTYPEQSFVRGDEYLIMLNQYKEAVPEGKQIVMGEIGFKYTGNDIELKEENEDRISNDPYASDDCNMFIYDSFYGIDMSDAMIQCMMAGFGGSLVWDMDDAMYNKPDYSAGDIYNAKKLKRWGFWNILGEEVCKNADDEEIRPFFYPISLLCRYFPAGSEIYKVSLPNKYGLRAIAAQKDGYYTIALVNSHYVSYKNLLLQADTLPALKNINKYTYLSGQGADYTGSVDENGFPLPEVVDMEMDLQKGILLDVKGQSVMVFTNMTF